MDTTIEKNGKTPRSLEIVTALFCEGNVYG